MSRASYSRVLLRAVCWCFRHVSTFAVLSLVLLLPIDRSGAQLCWRLGRRVAGRCWKSACPDGGPGGLRSSVLRPLLQQLLSCGRRAGAWHRWRRSTCRARCAAAAGDRRRTAAQAPQQALLACSPYCLHHSSGNQEQQQPQDPRGGPCFSGDIARTHRGACCGHTGAPPPAGTIVAMSSQLLVAILGHQLRCWAEHASSCPPHGCTALRPNGCLGDQREDQ